VPLVLRYYVGLFARQLRRRVPLMQHRVGPAHGRQGPFDGGMLVPQEARALRSLREEGQRQLQSKLVRHDPQGVNVFCHTASLVLMAITSPTRPAHPVPFMIQKQPDS